MRILACALAAATLLGISSAQGPVSEYFLIGVDRIYVVQGTQVVRSWPIGSAHEQGAIAVGADIRTMSFFDPDPGIRFTLEGVDTGIRYPHPGNLHAIRDGSTDLKFNYACDVTGAIYRFDRSWANPTFLMPPPPDGDYYTSVAYDPVNRSLWLTYSFRGVMENRSMSGQLLRRVSTSVNYLGALAFDQADNTLWGVDAANGRLHQFSRTGAYMQNIAIPGLSDPIYAGEFRMLPSRAFPRT